MPNHSNNKMMPLKKLTDKQKVFFDYKEIEKFTKDELYILIHKYMESINKLNNILNSII